MDESALKDAGTVPARLFVGGLLLITFLQSALLMAFEEKISNKELICSLSLTYLNSLVGLALYRMAFRGGMTLLLVAGLFGNFFRAIFFAVLMFGILSVGLKSSSTVLLVTLLCNLTVWMAEIGHLHHRTLNVYASRHERIDN